MVSVSIYNTAIETCERLDFEGGNWPCWTISNTMAPGVYFVVGKAYGGDGRVWLLKQKLVVLRPE
jgi:hypothetical protein